MHKDQGWCTQRIPQVLEPSLVSPNQYVYQFRQRNTFVELAVLIGASICSRPTAESLCRKQAGGGEIDDMCNGNYAAPLTRERQDGVDILMSPTNKQPSLNSIPSKGSPRFFLCSDDKDVPRSQKQQQIPG